MAALGAIHGGGLILGMDRIGFGYLGLLGGRWDRLLVWLLEGIMGWCLGWLISFACLFCLRGVWLWAVVEDMRGGLGEEGGV